MESDPKGATNLHTTCASCGRKMHISLLNAKKVISNVEMKELDERLGNTSIKDTMVEKSTKVEELEPDSDAAITPDEGIGKPAEVTGRRLRLTHSPHSERRYGCTAGMTVLYADFKASVQDAEETQLALVHKRGETH